MQTFNLISFTTLHERGGNWNTKSIISFLRIYMYRMIIRKRLWSCEFIVREDGMDRYTLVTLHTCLAPFYLTLELSLLLGPVQNQNLPSRGPKCAPHLPHSASLALCKQKNTLEIALDTLLSLVLIS